jgi:hypothetical protein
MHLPPAGRLCAAAAAATPQGALLSEASRRGGALHAAAAASHSESHPDRTGKLPQQADHARQGLVVQSSTRGLAVPRAPCDAMPRRAAAAPTSESAGPPPAWTGRRLPGPGRHALAGAPSPQGAMPPLAQRAPTRSLRAGRRRRPARRWRAAAAPGGGSSGGDGRQGREPAFRRVSRRLRRASQRPQRST